MAAEVASLPAGCDHGKGHFGQILGAMRRRAQRERGRPRRGGTILTVDDAQPQAEAVAVKDGRILAAGLQGEEISHDGPRLARRKRRLGE
jgi:hypothetical protein